MARSNRLKSKWKVCSFLAAACTSLIGISGCGQGSTPAASSAGTGGATKAADAFIDLDKVMDDVGWKTDVDGQMTQTINQSKQAFQDAANTIRKALQEKLDAIGQADHLTEEQLKNLRALNQAEMAKMRLTTDQRSEIGDYVRQSNEAIAGADRQLNQKFQEWKAQVVKTYRSAMTPSVRKVAHDRGFTMVMAKGGDAVFYTDPSIDITDAVTDDLRKTGSKPATPEPPRFNVASGFQFQPFGGSAATQPN